LPDQLDEPGSNPLILLNNHDEFMVKPGAGWSLLHEITLLSHCYTMFAAPAVVANGLKRRRG
jgi:hypothetical protein